MTALIRIARARADWSLALGLGALALVMRLWNLKVPSGKVFDETYYVPDARSLLLNGVELDSKTGTSAFIVHPPVGKWLIAGGIKVFGNNEFGWRFSAALIGSISVALTYLIAKQLFNSVKLSSFASLLILFDGLHLVLSRTALLDIFLLFFIQLAALAFLSKRYWFTGISLGLAISTKWSGFYLLVVLALFSLVLDYRRARFLGVDNSLIVALKNRLPIRLLQFGLLPISTYVISWTGWFATSNGWSRNWSPSTLKSFWHYQFEILNFHTTLTDSHPYEAAPWKWLIQARPTSFFYSDLDICGASKCSQEVLAIGTPILWWAAVLTLALTIWFWAFKREPQSEFLLLMIAALYLPWFAFPERTMFSFYALAFQPFLLLTLVYIVSKIKWRANQLMVIFLIFVALNFFYFAPLIYGTPVSYDSWSDHMWFKSWI